MGSVASRKSVFDKMTQDFIILQFPWEDGSKLDAKAQKKNLFGEMFFLALLLTKVVLLGIIENGKTGKEERK